MKTIFFSIVGMIYLAGCCSPKEVIREITVKYDTVKVTIPQDIAFDSVLVDDSGNGESVKYIVRVDTLFQKVFIKGKERIVKIFVPESVFVEKYIEKKSPQDGEDWSFRTYFLIVVSIISVALIIKLIGR